MGHPHTDKEEARLGISETGEGKTSTKEYRMNTSDILNKAADLIEERGWVQGGDPDDKSGPRVADPWAAADGRLCMEGGIAAAMGMGLGDFGAPTRTFYGCPAYNAVRDYLALRPYPLDCVWQFNDADDRTSNEVIEVLRAAAVIEAARESEAAQVSA